MAGCPSDACQNLFNVDLEVEVYVRAHGRVHVYHGLVGWVERLAS
jgi:hypothetical protein